MKVAMVLALLALGILALGGVALAAPPPGEVGHNGPTPPALGDPVATQSEVQWITVTVTTPPASGTFTLTGNLGTTAAIPYNATAAAVRTALGPAVTGGTAVLAVSGGPVSTDYDAAGVLIGQWYYRVMWVGAQAGIDQPLLTASGAGLTNATVTVEPYKEGQAFTGRVQPHGGYSATTDYCLQCHAVHDGEEYALLSNSSVTAGCRTCHSLYGTAATGPYVPGYPGVEAPTSLRSAYEVTSPLAQHAIGASSIPFASAAVGPITELGWAYGGFNATNWAAARGPAGPGTASDVTGGLYCGSCHTPHGNFGRLINSETGGVRTTGDGDGSLMDVDAFAEDTAIMYGRPAAVRYLHYDSTNRVWQACNETADITCTNLVATDTEGESAYLYGYKLLSAYPNHSWELGAESWGLDSYEHDMSRWCGRCHDEAIPSEYGGTYHNHPTGCTACHGVPNDATSTDFPHTSTFINFLKDYPDLLCINCHTAGSLP
jgi:predicted CXXCH cytochrome family protein